MRVRFILVRIDTTSTTTINTHLCHTLTTIIMGNYSCIPFLTARAIPRYYSSFISSSVPYTICCVPCFCACHRFGGDYLSFFFLANLYASLHTNDICLCHVFITRAQKNCVQNLRVAPHPLLFYPICQFAQPPARRCQEN